VTPPPRCLQFPWPKDLLDQPTDPSIAIDGEILFRGPRIRMGLSSGSRLDGSITDILPEPRTGRAKYLGSLLNHAARTASIAHGGQIIASNRTVAICPHAALAAAGVELRDAGQFEMKGFRGQHRMWEVVSGVLGSRIFPKARLTKVKLVSRPAPVLEAHGPARAQVAGGGLCSKAKLTDTLTVLVHDGEPAPSAEEESVVQGPQGALEKLPVQGGAGGRRHGEWMPADTAVAPHVLRPSGEWSTAVSAEAADGVAALASNGKLVSPASRCSYQAPPPPSLLGGSDGGQPPWHGYILGAPPSSLTATWVAAGATPPPARDLGCDLRPQPDSPASFGVPEATTTVLAEPSPAGTPQSPSPPTWQEFLEPGKMIDLGAPLSLTCSGAGQSLPVTGELAGVLFSSWVASTPSDASPCSTGLLPTEGGSDGELAYVAAIAQLAGDDSSSDTALPPRLPRSVQPESVNLMYNVQPENVQSDRDAPEGWTPHCSATATVVADERHTWAAAAE
jgi:hypothetical protein